ncbi:MAG: 16S rRNA (guanine(527)-N(7))-methyltransferase RsmG [Pirellulales bacterium]|nr:16S rRNA (guanine(527)-N(7))-methyltransferase RsmG [Pirellulales bacterium]
MEESQQEHETPSAPGSLDAGPAESWPDDTLAAALARHRLELPAAQVALLERYARLLWKTNEQLNLTRHTTWEKFVARDVVDSLQLAAHLAPGERVLDVGTGGGVPGIVLAIVRPDLKVTLCDSVGKKAKAVEAIVAELKLPVRVFNRFGQELVAERPQDTLVIRAVARLEKILRWFAPAWPHFRRMLVVKGPSWVDERGEARHLGRLQGLELRRVAAYPLPGSDSESVILEIRRQG